MKAELLHNTPLKIADIAIGTCWDKQRGTGIIDYDRIDRVANKFKHASTIEHLTYSFYISGISRALLQELARHRVANISVKSTRYTLKELKDEDCFNISSEAGGQGRASKYLVWTGITLVDENSVRALEGLRQIIKDGIANDKAKYCLPEAYKTELTWTINARSLQNFLHLRTSKAALWEIRDLANEIYNQLPVTHQFLFTKIVEDNKDDN